jgi:CheY-like chemotaxis protein
LPLKITLTTSIFVFYQNCQLTGYLYKMKTTLLHVLLADDDEDDCLFFTEAHAQLTNPARLTTVNDGEELMQLLLQQTGPLPDVLFLDLNMPRKSGYDCLIEIKKHQRLRQLPVVILSTSFDRDVADRLIRSGAFRCVQKPVGYGQLTALIQHTLTELAQENEIPPTDPLPPTP